MSAVVRNDGTGRACAHWAACDVCGWTSPTGGYITERHAQARADGHNAETHAMSAGSDG